MEEIAKNSFEVLMNGNYEWKSASDGNVPPNAVIGGRTSSGETLYIGRAVHSGVTTPGKVHPSHKCVYIPFGWKEHRYTNYEVLVSRGIVCQPMHPIYPPHCPPQMPPMPPNCPPGPPGHNRPHFPPGRGHHHQHQPHRHH